MTIDTTSEELVEFRKAMKLFPGRTPCIQTGYRWAKVGVLLADGVTRIVLESLSIGGIRFTSTEAIQRFIERQNGGGLKAAKTSPSQRARRSAAARRVLQELGVP